MPDRHRSPVGHDRSCLWQPLPMPEPSIADAVAFVADHYEERAGAVTPLGAGQWSRAFAFGLDGADAVIRFGRHGDDFGKDRVMAARASPALPIPRFVEMGAALGGWFAVTERARGEFLDELSGAAIGAALPAVFDALSAIRDIAVPASAGAGMWHADGSTDRASWREALLAIANDEPGGRTHRWRARLEASPTGAAPFDAALDRLTALVDRCPEDRAIVHNDLLYRNVLVQGDRISAVFDWANSQYGDHLYDLAWLIYWWPWFPRWQHIDIEDEVRRYLAGRGEAWDDVAERLLTYRIHVGLDAQAYNAFTGHYDELARNAHDTLALARR